MKVKSLIFISFIFLAYFSSGQTYSSIISDEEIYNTINAIIKNDNDRIKKKGVRKISVSPKISNQWDSLNFIRLDTAKYIHYQFYENFEYIFKDYLDTLFNEIDKKFMFEQYKSIKDTVWHQAFSQAKLVDGKQRNPDRYCFSVPIFSVDKKVVVIYFSNYCGELCGFGGYYIYKKTSKNKWIFITAIGHWIS